MLAFTVWHSVTCEVRSRGDALLSRRGVAMHGNTHGEGFESPEEAAVASYPSLAKARVVSAVRRRGRATVKIQTEPPYLYTVRCEFHGGLWYDVSDHN
jgi:hypothetical protein